jgi:transcription termination factor NusB
MDTKPNDEMIRSHIQTMSSNTSRSESNDVRLTKVETKVGNLENTYTILSKVENQIDNINEKIDMHLTKRTTADRILDAVIPAIVYGAIMAYFFFTKGGF